jgi:hypothetical protein
MLAKTPNRKAAVKYLAAGGAVPMTIIECDGLVIIVTGNTTTGNVAARWWIASAHDPMGRCLPDPIPLRERWFPRVAMNRWKATLWPSRAFGESDEPKCGIPRKWYAVGISRIRTWKPLGVLYPK